MVMEPRDMLTDPETLWDSDLILSKDTSSLYPIDLSKKGVFRLYTDYEKQVRYAKIAKSDKNYFEIMGEVRKGGLELEERQDVSFIKLNVVDKNYFALEKIERKMGAIPGVLKDPFSIWIRGREYFRYRFIDIANKKISEGLLEALELSSELNDSYLKVEYLGTHMNSASYFKRYDYPRKIVRIEFLESDSSRVEDFFPHYKHNHIFFFILGENNEKVDRVIRFSLGPTETKGVMKESHLIRDKDLKVYEDIRDVREFSLSKLSREPFYSFPLESYQIFDGKSAHMNWVIDEDDLPLIIKRINQFNRDNTGQVKMILESVNVI